MSISPAASLLMLLAILSIAPPACLGGDEHGLDLPELTPFDEALAGQLEAIEATAAEVRGLEPHEGIEQGTLPQQDLAAYYREAATEARLQEDINYGALNTTYRLLHMIGPDDDLLDLSQAEATVILGFYAPEDDQLVLVSEAPDHLSLADEVTLAHEYIHSFQDQRFDLEKLLNRGEEEEKKKENTEYGDTLRALIEGDAALAQYQYLEKRLGPEGAQQWLASWGSEDGDWQTDVPPAFARYAAFPYTYGTIFVRHLYDEGGWEAVNDAYDSPPTTEEQILHPEMYLRGEEPVGISLRDLSGDLGKGWGQETDVVFGEFDVYNWLRSTLDNEFQAISAAAGWGGGRIAVYTNPKEDDRVLVHIALIWDDAQEAREFYAAFGQAVRLIDPEPAVLDDPLQTISWEAPDEVGYAWIDRISFQMIVAVNSDDLEAAGIAIDAPGFAPEPTETPQED